uniref:ATR-interacting protein mus304 n=1 Tax=Culex tarsalis TaxID=7177 RepID=A0A1Q3EX81_CULTA
MAAKRHGNFQLKVPSASYKKARLEIEMVSSQQYHQHRQQQQPAVRTPTAVVQSSDSLWGEEDDEFIMLASQAVEEVELFQHSQTADVTFGRFAKQAVPSSTQAMSSDELMPPPAATGVPGPSRVRPAAEKKVLPEVIDLLTDGDDDVFTENYDDIEKHIDNFFNNEVDDDFKLDDIRQEDAGEPVPVEEPKPVQAAGPSRPRFLPTQVDREAQLNAAKKKEHAQDLQIKFLTNQLEKASKKTEQIQKECNEALERLHTREGEAAVLRYQLENAKSINDQLRLDKMKESETAAKEWATKIKDLSNVIVAQQSELEFKSLEMMNLRTKRMSNSFRGAADKSILYEPPVTKQDFRIHHRKVKLFLHRATLSYEIDPKIFDRSLETISNNRLATFSKGDSVIFHCLGSLQTHLSQLAAQRRPPPPESIDAIIATSTQALTETLKYANQLKLVRVKYKHLGPKVAFEFLCKNAKRTRLFDGGEVNINQRDAIFPDEQAVLVRRFLAALAILGRYVAPLAVSLVRSHCTAVLGKALNKIGYAVELYQHLGMVTAAAAVLRSLCYHVGAMEERAVAVMNLFKSIVYCRPDSALTLTYLSEALCRISDQSIDLLNHLCWRSKPESFKLSETTRTIQFTKDSCVLQIYAALLECSVPQNRTLTRLEVDRLVANTRHTIFFLRNAVARPVRWIRHFYRHPEQPSRSPTQCQCHIRITNAFVVLLHQVLRCWNQCPLSIANHSMLQIAQDGVLLLYDLFQTVYRGIVLRVGGHAIECRLQASYNWLVQHQDDFRFQDSHKMALRRLNLRLFMDEPLKTGGCEGASSRTDTDSERADQTKQLYEDFFDCKKMALWKI